MENSLCDTEANVTRITKPLPRSFGIWGGMIIKWECLRDDYVVSAIMAAWMGFIKISCGLCLTSLYTVHRVHYACREFYVRVHIRYVNTYIHTCIGYVRTWRRKLSHRSTFRADDGSSSFYECLNASTLSSTSQVALASTS